VAELASIVYLARIDVLVWIPIVIPANSSAQDSQLKTVEMPSETTEPSFVASILLVEDNAVNKRIAIRMLEKAGHDVIAAGDGETALAQWQSRPFDAIFMDCHMPGMDGYQATQRSKSRKGRSRIPIIALTASAMTGERERCLESGMDDYLPNR